MSVHQTADGRWYAKLTRGKDKDFPERTKVYFGRGDDAENKARQYNSELGLGKKERDSGKTFADLSNYYLES